MDTGDLSVMDFLESVDAELVNMRQEQLRKLEAGTYGICVSCGQEIAEERLNAVPFAVYCLRCEEKAELRKRRGKGPTL